MSGRRHPERFSAELEAVVDFYDLRGILESLFDARGIPDVTFERAIHPAFREGVAAEVRANGASIGVFGEVHPDLVAEMRLRYPVFLALLQVGPLLACAAPTAHYQPLPAYPSTERDIAFVADETLEHRAVLAAIDGLKVKNLVKVALFDIFRDEAALGAGRKSMAYSLTFRNDERTLTDKEVNQAYESLRKRLPEVLPVELR